jgi:copper resistance protein B
VNGSLPVSLAVALAAIVVLVAPEEVSGQHADNAVFHHSRLGVDLSSSPGPTVMRGRGNGWIGTDFDRIWWSATGERADGTYDEVRAVALYGHYVRRFWDVVVGYRQDIEPITQGYLAFGIQGLAPYWFDVSLLGFVSDRGKPSIRLEAGTDLYLTQRLVLQPSGEVDLLLADDDEWDVGAGARQLELGARVRYEVRRKFAPYVDLTWVDEKDPRSGLRVEPDTEGLRLGVGLRLIY